MLFNPLFSVPTGARANPPPIGLCVKKDIFLNGSTAFVTEADADAAGIAAFRNRLYHNDLCHWADCAEKSDLLVSVTG